MLGHDLARDETHRQPHSKRNHDRVIDQADHGQGFRNEIDRAQNVNNHEKQRGFGRPADPRIPKREIEGVGLGAKGDETGRPAAETQGFIPGA